MADASAAPVTVKAPAATPAPGAATASAAAAAPAPAGAAALLTALADADEDASGPMPPVLPKTFIQPQCLTWFNMLVDLYNTVKSKASQYQTLAGSTSMFIIVLNVLIVGKGDLKLSDVVVAFFVIIMTVLKAIQVQFQFASTSTQLEVSLGAIRDTLVHVENTKSMGAHGPNSEDSFVTKVEYLNLKKQVNAAVQAVPQWVLLSLAKKPAKNKASPTPSAGPNGVDSEAKAPAGRTIDADQTHLSAPPIDDADVEAQGPIRLLQVDGVHTMQAAAPVDPAGVCEDSIAVAVAQAQEAKNAAMVQVQLKILNGMTATLNPAAKAAAKFDKVFHTIATTQTAIELAINAMIMAISSIPDGSFIDLSNEKNAVLALLAAVNGVIKGIDMKMQFEVLRANAAETDKAIKTLKSKVENKVVELDALQTPLEEAAFAAYKNEFQALVTKYANWLGNNA